jgi:hypothetical protein
VIYAIPLRRSYIRWDSRRHARCPAQQDCTASFPDVDVYMVGTAGELSAPAVCVCDCGATWLAVDMYGLDPGEPVYGEDVRL